MNPVISAILLVLIIIFLICACLFVYATNPGKFRWFDLPVVYCHRGYYDNEQIPENSLAAFRLSAEKNLAVELDVRLSADGEIVVFHDDSLKRVCGVDRPVRELTLAELKELPLLGTQERIPTFAEALAACGGVPIYCEVKTDGNEVNEEFLRKVYDLIKTYDSQIVVVSFNPFVLRWFKDNHPELIRGFLSCDFSETKGKPHPLMYKALANLMSNFLAKPDFISYRFTDKSFGLNMCRFYGARLVAWTVRSMDDVERAADLGYSTFVGEHFDMTEV